MNARQYRSLHYKNDPHISKVLDKLDSSSIGMEFIQQEMRADLAGFTEKPPVYNSTTIPIQNGKYQNGVSNGVNGNGHPPVEEDSDGDSDMDTHFSNLPHREPVDIEFKDLSLTVGLGFRKGEVLVFFFDDLKSDEGN